MRISAAAPAFILILLHAAMILTPAPADAEGYSRIVSLAPNITETLYALGLGDRVAGVTRFCAWPPEAGEKPDVGGYFDPNLEAIVSLEPDLVIMLPAHQRLRPFLEELDIEYLTVANETISEIIGTVRAIGDRCGVGERAAQMADSLEREVDSACPAGEESVRPRVLIVVDRQYGTEPDEVYAAASGTWYDELVVAAGGTNVLKGTSPAYPMLSPESLVHLQPDIIIDIVPGAGGRGLEAGAIAADWGPFDMLRAVTDRRVHVLTGRYAAVPGPRFVRLLEELCAIFHDRDENEKGRPRPSLE
jgi:iron complex transport system substrate-binding protein